ncbi:MAG: LPS export ABC transporter permease LptF [Gammaproteobacteria bacterium]|nr:LPS export ABC transporter permease LptF [Gammaproteobacteria bacterium]
MLIFRYLAKEVFTTLFALTGILLLIFMSNQFVRYIARAASGKIPATFILKLLALELPMLMGLLMPLGFYMALLLAYGRLYADSEMTVLHACGYGPPRLLKHSLMMASGVALFVLVILLWINPAIAVERTKLLRSTGIQVLIQTLEPGKFGSLPGEDAVFYVEKMKREHAEAEGIFLARLDKHKKEKGWDVLWADKANITSDPKTGSHELVLTNGHAYQGQPGHADYRVVDFKRYETPLPEPVIVPKKGDLRALKTADLWPFTADEHAKAAELVWRFSIPLMVIVLTLIGVPLCRVNPRAGKYARLLPAILLFILYADFMFVARDAIASGKLPWWLGMGCLHGSMILIGFGLIWRNRVRLS